MQVLLVASTVDLNEVLETVCYSNIDGCSIVNIVIIINKPFFVSTSTSIAGSSSASRSACLL